MAARKTASTKKASRPLRTCFFVAPIGAENSEVRQRSDQVSKYIVDPVCDELGYKTVRADEISQPGVITSQVLQHVLTDDLVIADLSGRNPNVFYELAIRHAFRKPFVQLIDVAETIPFDVAALRTVMFDLSNLDSVDKAKAELARQIEAVESRKVEIETPISASVDLQQARESGNLVEKSLATIQEQLQAIAEMVRRSDSPQRVIARLPRADADALRAGLLTMVSEGIDSATLGAFITEKSTAMWDEIVHSVQSQFTPAREDYGPDEAPF